MIQQQQQQYLNRHVYNALILHHGKKQGSDNFYQGSDKKAINKF